MAVWPLGPAARHVSGFVWVKTALGPAGRAPLSTVKLVEEDAVPLGVVTAMCPVVAPTGTVAVIWVSESTVNVALTSLKLTEVTLVKSVPVITTDVPTGPEVGVNEAMERAAQDELTMKSVSLRTVPPANVVTRTGPSVASLVTITLSDVAVSTSGTVCVASVAYGLNRTRPPTIVVPSSRSRFVTVITRTVPAAAQSGTNESTVGAHAPAPDVERKVPVLVVVPAGFVTRML